MELQGKPLYPRSIVDIRGNLSYSEGAQSWGILRFKKELIKEFPQLQEKRSKFSYKMTYFRDFAELEEKIKEMKRSKEQIAMPMLVWLYKEG